MMQKQVDDAVAAWAFTRKRTLAEVANMPAGRFEHRPHPEARSVAEICQHIAESGLLFSSEIARPDGSFARAPLPQLYAEASADMPRPGERAALLDLLQATWKTAEERLRALTPDFLFTDMGTLGGSATPRIEMLRFADKHEFYHCGQITVYERMVGVVPDLTKVFTAQG